VLVLSNVWFIGKPELSLNLDDGRLIALPTGFRLVTLQTFAQAKMECRLLHQNCRLPVYK